MRSRRQAPSLAAQLLVLQLVVVAVVLAVVGLISVGQATRTFETERGTAMRAVAEYVANQEIVRTLEGDPVPLTTLAPPIDQALRLSGATRIDIADPQGLILASSDPVVAGSVADTDDSRVFEGRGWTGDVSDGDIRTVAGHAPILDDDGDLVGVVLARQEYPTVWERLTNAAPDLVLYLGVGAGLGVIGSLLLSRSFKKRTRGLAADEIATLADHREALLHAVGEGVIAVGPDQRVTMVNDSARVLLQLGDDVQGRPVAELGLPDVVAGLLASTGDARDEVAVVGDRVLVLDRRSAASGGRGIGTVTTLRDRTELASLQSRLSSNLSLTETLRAQTHEFANQLHTISGLVQLGEYAEVTELVGELTRRRAEVVEYVAARVDDRAVAALLVAKSSAADEAGVRLTLSDESRLPVVPTDLAADLVTVIGNLVDNAVDACRGRAGGAVGVRLGVNGALVRLEVVDNGPGIPEDQRDLIFVRGFSTKPETEGGRGIGLPLVHLVCTRRGGSVTLVDPARDDGEMTGAAFVAELPLERP